MKEKLNLKNAKMTMTLTMMKNNYSMKTSKTKKTSMLQLLKLLENYSEPTRNCLPLLLTKFIAEYYPRF